MLQAASMMLAPGARAQSGACDQLKVVLSARIEATGVRGYALEAVAADTPVPPDAKVIGTCESGAKKILYRRGAALRSALGAPAASAPAAAPAHVAAPAAALPQAAAPPDRPRPSPPPLREPPMSPPAAASEAEVARVIAPVIASDGPVVSDPPRAESAPGQSSVSDFFAEHWRWIGALLLLPIAAGALWIWRVRYGDYDATGLPRGPKF